MELDILFPVLHWLSLPPGLDQRDLGSVSLPVGSLNFLYFSGHMPCFPGESIPLGSTASCSIVSRIGKVDFIKMLAHLEFLNKSLVSVVVEIITISIQI